MSATSKKTLWLTVGTLVPIAAWALSFSADRPTMLCAAGLLLGSLILWCSEALPISISTMLMICLLPLLGLMSFSDAVLGFNTNTALFIMASSGITVALSSSHIPDRVTAGTLSRFQGRSRQFLFVFGIVVALFSAFMSSLATCALFSGIMTTVLEKNNIQPRKSGFGKGVMLIIPACAGIGGFMTPAGTPANILVMELLAKQGYRVSFSQWTLIGMPVGLIAASVFLLSVLTVHPPEKLTFAHTVDAQRWEPRDLLILCIIGLIILFWFLSGLCAALSTSLIALLGLILMLVPSLHILTFREFSDGVNWDLVLTMGSVSILMTAVSESGLIAAVASVFISMLRESNATLTLILISVILCSLRAFIPTTSAVIALFAPLLTAIAGLNGISMPVLMFILSFWAASELLLVFTEPIFLITYKTGYYSQLDLTLAGIGPCLLLSVLISLLIPGLLRAAGLC